MELESDEEFYEQEEEKVFHSDWHSGFLWRNVLLDRCLEQADRRG